MMVCKNWQYLITLDSDLNEVSRYVDIRSGNFGTFSIEFVRLLLAAGSEIDVVAKLLCEKIDASKGCKNINEYRDTITDRYPKFHSMIIDVPIYEFQLTPWADWQNGQNPSWWRAYNDVKHQRDSHFSDANLENTIKAIAGLYVMIWYLHREDPQRKKLNKTVLLSVDRYYIGGSRWADANHYAIPEDE
ncbi:MAG: hypothetical protein ABII79_09375 [bacterium]